MTFFTRIQAVLHHRLMNEYFGGTIQSRLIKLGKIESEVNETNQLIKDFDAGGKEMAAWHGGVLQAFYECEGSILRSR